jgi:flagellar biosynthetic protein FliR
MISVTSAQLNAWLAVLLFPLARVLGLFFSAPIFGNNAIPQRIKFVIGFLVTVAIIPLVPPMPDVPPGSWVGLSILARQVLIGVLLGFSLRIAFSAVDMAGQLIGLQMGLSFAIFYDPLNASQTPVVAEFFGLMALLIFLALDGHLLSLSLLARSFTLLPVSANPLGPNAYSAFLAWGATIFSAGLLLSLPLIAALLIANIAMGVLSRVAPQLNLFAVGFPVTIVSGFLVTVIALPYFAAALERLFEQGFAAMTLIMKAGA